MGEKGRAIVVPRDADEARRELAERMGSLHISRIDEMPRIELYLDQLLTLVTLELEFMRVPGDPAVTGSMVNNYVKQGVIPAPRKKRYTRRHLASLLAVCALKRVFSIAQVKQLIESAHAAGADLGALYDEACGLLERSLAACFSSASPDEAPCEAGIGAPGDGTGLDPTLGRLVEAAVTSLATKVYVEQTLLIEERGARA